MTPPPRGWQQLKHTARALHLRILLTAPTIPSSTIEHAVAAAWAALDGNLVGAVVSLARACAARRRGDGYRDR